MYDTTCMHDVIYKAMDLLNMLLEGLRGDGRLQ
jgi:hypothetical protein